jgi:hypothetical protein
MTLIGTTAIASVALAGVGFFSRPSNHIEASPPPSHPPAPLPAPPPAQPGDRATLPGEEPAQPVPVKFTNPFDANEVFEFPPGTSETEARDAVASMLLERARERRNGSVPLERVSSTRSAHRR